MIQPWINVLNKYFQIIQLFVNCSLFHFKVISLKTKHSVELKSQCNMVSKVIKLGSKGLS